MLNLQPLTANSLIIYADTVSAGKSVGDFFLLVLTNTSSKQTFAVVPNVLKRNKRFVELEINLVASEDQNDPLNGDIWLYPEGNWTYVAFNTNIPTVDPSNFLPCLVWNTAEEFWNFAESFWGSCGITTEVIDRGQAFLYSENPAEREVEFIAYEGGNNILESIVYVTGSTGSTGNYQFFL